MLNYYAEQVIEEKRLARSKSTKHHHHGGNNNHDDDFGQFQNKLVSQEKSMLNQTFTMGTNTEQRTKTFCIEDAINGFLPRARSSGPRTTLSSNLSNDDNVRRVRSETASLFSSTCKLPHIDGSTSSVKKTCTIRPWSRTQVELQKFKETLKASGTSSTTSN